MPRTILDNVQRDSPIATGPVPPPRNGLSLIALSGAAGKTSTGWILVHIFEQAGLEVGAWLSDGVYVDRTFRQDELHAWELATNAARAREIDVLIQEIPSVLAGNLAPNTVAAGVFTSICGNDGQCQRDTSSQRDRLAVGKVMSSIKDGGRAVVNADDAMIVDAIPGNIQDAIYYAMNAANPILREHLQSGGDGCWVDDGCMMAQINGEIAEIVKTADLPASLAGHLIFQVQNTLAAVAAALPLARSGVDLGQVLRNLSANDPKRRSGVREIEPAAGTMIVDSPRSLLSVRQIARGVRSYGARRVIIALDDFASLTDEDAMEAARVLGSIAGMAILVGGSANRNRIDLLKEGLMRSVTPPAVIYRDRMDSAVAYIRTLLKQRDVALVLNPATDRPLG